MSVRYSNNNRLDKYFTVLFLIIFLLIKISPSYYIYQYQSAFTRAKNFEHTRLNSTDSQSKYLVRVDKSIVEQVDRFTIPDIKFAGIPFVFFFIGGLFVMFTSAFVFISQHPIRADEVCITQRNLRL
ncbi:MAG: hypothetical protein JST19_05885 [Bacteroidetes bacterium]|nr:hypothetical protein [Bacteroidota bacterium]